MKNKISQKLAALEAERDELLKAMNQIRADYEVCRERVLELNGSIQATQEMFKMLGDVQGDTESEIIPGTDTNEG